MENQDKPLNLKALRREREIAFQILMDALGPQKANLHQSLAEAEERYKVEGSPKGLLRQLVLGVVQWKARLEWIVSTQFAGYYKAPLPVRVLLLMGTYQVVMLDRIPFYAAVNETMKLFHAGLAPSKYKPVINGVLREIARAPYPHIGHMQNSEDAFFVAYSHPRWLVRRWRKRLGIEEAVALCKANCLKAPFSIRLNPLKISFSELRKELRRLDIECKPHPLSPEMVVLLTPVNIYRVPLFHQGLFLPQDISSWIVPRVLDPRPGEHVLDCCAAPGIKTTQISSLMENSGEIVAVEREPGRTETLKETCHRWGAENVEIIEGDIREVSKSAMAERRFHRVLVDAPCSDLGVIRRHPEIRWRRKSGDLRAYATVQGEILDAVAPLVSKGGVMVYSVCSTEPEEGEQTIKGFLKRHTEFCLDELDKQLPGPFVEKARVEQGTLWVAPHLLNADGFFVARLRKQ